MQPDYTMPLSIALTTPFLLARPNVPAFEKVVVLPECWNSPYDTASFPVYAEPVPDVGEGPPSQDDSPSVAMLCRTAADNKVYLIGGSVPESGKDGAFYNTCVIVGPEGIILAKHRKVHLFDIDIPGEITFM